MARRLRPGYSDATNGEWIVTSPLSIVTVVGARPQFVKAAVVSQALAQAGVAERIVHTGQHYDAEMSGAFFDELGLAAPAVNLGVGSGWHGAQTGAMMERLEAWLIAEQEAGRQAGGMLVYGDTNSTLAASLVASKLHLPIAHVEAGVRSFDRRMPEEVNRVVTDAVADLLFCPDENARTNLAAEGITSGVYVVGDVMYDATLRSSERAAQQQPLATLIEHSAWIVRCRHSSSPLQHRRSRASASNSRRTGRIRFAHRAPNASANTGAHPIGQVDRATVGRSIAAAVVSGDAHARPQRARGCYRFGRDSARGVLARDALRDTARHDRVASHAGRRMESTRRSVAAGCRWTHRSGFGRGAVGASKRLAVGGCSRAHRSAPDRGVVVSKPILLFSYLSPSSFVRDDLELLSDAFDVRPFHFDATQARSVLGLARLWKGQLDWLRRELPGAGVVLGWFADHHMALPVAMARRAGVPTAVVLSGTDVNVVPSLGYGALLSRWRAPLVRYVVRNASLLLPVTPSLVEHENTFAEWPRVLRNGVRAHVPDVQTPIQVVLPGLDASRWEIGGDVRSPSVIAAALCGNERTFRLKGLDVLADVARLLPDLPFRVLGIAPDFARQLPVLSNLTWEPATGREALGQAFREASVILHPSRSEGGLPLVVAEAMLSGCIPVGSPVGGLPQLIPGIGELVARPDPAEIAAAVHRALGYADERRSLARERIVEGYSFSARKHRLVASLQHLSAS